MEIDILENGGICKMLILMLNHPEGVQRVFYRTQLNLGSRAAMRNHNLLFESKLIENIPSKDKFLFALTEKGKKTAGLLLEIRNL